MNAKSERVQAAKIGFDRNEKLKRNVNSTDVYVTANIGEVKITESALIYPIGFSLCPNLILGTVFEWKCHESVESKVYACILQTQRANESRSWLSQRWCDVVLSLNRVWFVCSDDSTYFSLMCEWARWRECAASVCVCVRVHWLSCEFCVFIHFSFCWFIISFNFSHFYFLFVHCVLIGGAALLLSPLAIRWNAPIVFLDLLMAYFHSAAAHSTPLGFSSRFFSRFLFFAADYLLVLSTDFVVIFVLVVATVVDEANEAYANSFSEFSLLHYGCVCKLCAHRFNHAYDVCLFLLSTGTARVVPKIKRNWGNDDGGWMEATKIVRENI